MYACMYIWTPFLRLRTFLLNHLYYLCLLGPLNTLCHNWFSKPLDVCLLFSLTVSTYFEFFMSFRVSLSPPGISSFFLSWLSLALLISLFLDMLIGLSFRLSAVPGSLDYLNIPYLPIFHLSLIQRQPPLRHSSLVLALFPHSFDRVLLHFLAYRITPCTEDALL